MIAEALLFATARTSPELRRLGLVGDAVALWSRATRRRASWRAHEERCHGFVSAAVGERARRGTVLVLGSGLLRDVPLPLLASRFERVVLVDAVHLWPARRRAGRLGAELVVADLSGDGGRDAGNGSLARWAAGGDVELAISANLLSQMPLAHLRRAGDGNAAAVARAIARRHLSSLAALGCEISLLTDIAFRDLRPDGSASAETPLVDEGLLPAPNESWDWEVAPRGEIDRSFARVHRVGAWRLAPGAIADILARQPDGARP